MKSAQALFRAFLVLVITLPIGAGSLPRIGSKSPVPGGVRHAAGKPGVVSLRSLEPLKEAFQRDIGKIRLVILVSPT